ncbi:PepSY domain-containing protein [Halosquirtibacter xylanolyticus]|uniref:PepSY-associated TM helix domain-containing protein n=1 Tax=Halosquirtibacter xylanolyticus TaxID=3374599 RepID=UPI003747B98D|nr:PepSY domain-containing protein [Prolixibacteraceae bacterium]
MKKKIFIIHQYIGLVTGLLMFLTSISGALYVFEKELFHAFHHDVLYVDQIGDQSLPIDKLWDIAQREVDGYDITSVKTYQDPSRSWEFKSYHQDNSAVTYFDWITQDKIVYINPYNGKVIGLLNHKYEFFQLVKMFHWSYFLRTAYGQPIVGAVTLLFFICLITGLWLWWPKKGIKKGAFKLRFNKWRVLNRDIHFTLGALTFPLAIVICITGMIWAFRWMMAIVYLIFNLGVNSYDTTVPKSIVDHQDIGIYQEVYSTCKDIYTDAYAISIYQPKKSKESTVNVFVQNDKAVYYNSARLSFNQYNGHLVRSSSFEEASSGEKAIMLNYDIHVGAIGGIFGKILMFLIAIVLAALPITGYFLWVNKKK